MISKGKIINFIVYLASISLIFIIILHVNPAKASDNSESNAEQWLLSHNKDHLKISNDKTNYIVRKDNQEISLPKTETDDVVSEMLAEHTFYEKHSKLTSISGDSNQVGPEYPVEKAIGPSNMGTDGKYLSTVGIRNFGIPQSSGSLLDHKDNSYENMTKMILTLNQDLIFNKGHFDLKYTPKNINTPWYDGTFNLSGYFPFQAQIKDPLDPLTPVFKNYYSGSYGNFVRFQFPMPTDIKSMAKAIDFSDSGAGAASDMGLSALSIINLPFTDINYPITPYANYTSINQEYDPQGVYVDIRGVDLNKHPDNSDGYHYKQSPTVVAAVMKLLGPFGDINGKASAHFNIDLSQYTGNYSTKELEAMGYDKQSNADAFVGADDSPKKILTKHTLPPSPDHKYTLNYNVYGSQALLAPSLGKSDGSLNNIDDAVVNSKKMDLGKVKSSAIDTWSAYMSPWDTKNTFNTKSVSSDSDNEFDETGSQTNVLPGTNFRERKINFDVAKDGKFIDNPSRFDRVIDFFTKENVTNKPISGENRKSDIQYVDVTRNGDPDQYNKWVTLTYNGQAHYKDGSTAGLQSIQSNTLQIYQKATPPTLKIDQLPKTYPFNQAVKITGSVSSSEHYTADKNMTDVYYQLDGGKWQKGTTEQVNSYKSGKFNMELGNDLALGAHTVTVKGTDAFHLDTNIETYKFDITSASLRITKQVVDLSQVSNPKDSDYKDNVTGLPGDQFRYHIHLDTTSGSTNHIIFKDNDLTDTANFDESSENYAIIHHNDGSSDERVKLTADDFTSPNTIDFSKKFKSDQIGEGSYIDLYFTVNTFSLVTPIGTTIPNTVYITSTADGDNSGQGWASNTANINFTADPTMIKQVKLASDKDSAYTDKIEASPDSDLDYRVQIKPNKDVKDPELNEIKLSDPFDNKLNQGLTLKKVTANYYDADNKIINDQTEVLTPDSHQVVVLSHPVVPGGHVDIVYQVHLDQATPAGTTFKNIAYMESSSYGKNPDHQLPNWQTNNAQVTVKKAPLSTNEGTVPMGGGALGYTLGSHMYVDKLLSEWDYANQDDYSGLGKFNFYFKDNNLSTYATLFRDYQDPTMHAPRLNSTSTIMVGVDGAIPQGGAANSITNITKNSGNSGPSQTVDFEYDIAISGMKFHVRSTLKPTPYGLVTANDHITNISGKDLNSVTFGRVQDTAIGTDWKGEDGVPIYYIGRNNGLYIKSGNHQLFYYFKRQNGPQGWKGTRYDTTLMNTDGDSTAFYDNDQFGFKGPMDHNQAATNAKAGAISNNNRSDTAILMKWDPVTLKNGASIDRSFDIGVKNTEEKAPELTLDQTDQSYSGGDVALSGQVKDDDSPTADLYYSIDDGPKQTIADKYAVSSTWKKWNGKIPAEQLSLGHKHVVKVWAIDPDSNYSTVQTFNLSVTNVNHVSQTVENVTTGAIAINNQVEVNQDDQVRYTFTANFVKYGDTNPLNNIVLTTDENNKQYTDADGKLSDISDYPIECSVDNGKTWTDISKDNPAPDTSNGVKITIPDKVKVSENDILLIRYSKKVSGLPTENKYFYNDGNVAANGTSETVSDNNTKLSPISDGTINFKYVDLDTGKEIAGHDPVQVTGKVDHKVSEYTKDQLAPAYIDGYTVIKEQIDDQAIQRASKADPVIAQKPQTYTYYYEKAALSMEAPKNWNFGRYNTSKTEATYYLPARQDASGKAKPYTVDVHDAYGVKDWTLKVQQKHQFTGVNPTNKKATILSGAQLNFDHLNAQKTSDDNQDTHPQDDQLDLLSGAQFKLPVGNETPTDLMSYHNAGTYVTEPDQNPAGTQYDNPGVKSFAYQFGDETNAGYSIGLHVPASTKREATDYTTTLTWSLSVTP